MNIIYSLQCPWIARFVEEIRNNAAYEKHKLKFIELKTAKDAQQAPSLYVAFNLV